jgi:hypothetical protein
VPGDCATPCNPYADGIQGRQNTVTNALCLMLASRLAMEEPVFQADADAVFGFLKSWCTLKPPPQITPPPPPILYDLNPHAVILERVPRTKSWPDSGYQRKFAWSGDQGLFLGALLDYYALKGDDGFALSTAKRVLKGITSYLTGTNQVLKPWAGGHAPAGDDKDYKTGVGVCMRYLQNAFQTNDMAELMREPGFRDFMQRNAEEVAKGCAASDFDELLICLTNNLATLVAAIVILS